MRTGSRRWVRSLGLVPAGRIPGLGAGRVVSALLAVGANSRRKRAVNPHAPQLSRPRAAYARLPETPPASINSCDRLSGAFTYTLLL